MATTRKVIGLPGPRGTVNGNGNSPKEVRNNPQISLYCSCAKREKSKVIVKPAEDGGPADAVVIVPRRGGTPTSSVRWTSEADR